MGPDMLMKCLPSHLGSSRCSAGLGWIPNLKLKQLLESFRLRCPQTPEADGAAELLAFKRETRRQRGRETALS